MSFKILVETAFLKHTCDTLMCVFLIPQGYPCELLALTVAGIPSMHICLDFIPELIAQPELEKQVQCTHLAGESLWV